MPLECRKFTLTQELYTGMFEHRLCNSVITQSQHCSIIHRVHVLHCNSQIFKLLKDFAQVSFARVSDWSSNTADSCLTFIYNCPFHCLEQL